MAEESNELIFDADMSRVNKAISDIEDKARNQPITVAVTPAGTASNFPYGLRGGGPPNATAILALDRRGDVNALPPVGGGGSGGDGAGGGGGGGTAPGAPPIPQGGAGLGNFFLSLYATRRLLNFGGDVLQAGRQYNIHSAMAGGNQALEFEAQQQYRSSIISAGGFIGQAVAYLADPSGSNEAGGLAMIAQAKAQDEQRSGMRSGADIRRRIEQDSATVQAALTLNPVNVAIANVSAQTGDRIASIQRAREEQVGRNAETLRSYRAQQTADFKNDVAALGSGIGGRGIFIRNGQFVTAEDIINQRNAAAANALQGNLALTITPFNSAEENERGLEEKRKEVIRREHEVSMIGIRSSTVTQNQVTRALAAGDTEGARIIGMQGQASAVLAEMRAKNAPTQDILDTAYSLAARIQTQQAVDARSLTNLNLDLQGRTAVTHLTLDREPLLAQMREAVERRASIIRGDPARFGEGTEARQNLNRSFAAEVAKIGQDDADIKRYRRAELTGEAEALRLDLAAKPLAAGSVRARVAAEQEATLLRERQGDPDAARQVLENAILSQAVRKRQILEAVDAAEININTTALNSPRQGEDIGELLTKIDANITGLRTDIAAGGAATTTD